MIGNAEGVAKLLRVPYVPVTPFFPLLGPLGMVPLPSKWIIGFGEPVTTYEYGPEAADDPDVVEELSERVRNAVQTLIDQQLAQRGSVFF